VTAPSITRENWTILGWNNTNKRATSASVVADGTITLSKDTTTYYAVTEKTITWKFKKWTWVSSISKTSGTCKINN
jgi:hypothetical protein